ncbi:IS110 family transposase, partial [Sulfobacillus harzensis]
RARDLGAIPYRLDAVTEWVRRQPDATTILVCYEAGPTGFGLARHLQRLQVACDVIAPGLIPQKAADRVKTDRRDARKLAEDLRSGSLTPVHLPTANEEAFRDLVRARASAVEDRRRLRHRMKSALLRWDIHRPEGMLAWRPRYRQWIRTLNPAPALRSTVWAEWLAQLEELDTRVQRLDAAIQLAMPEHPLYPLMLAFQTLRGVDWITAATLVAEGGDFSQFRRPSALMAFTGLVPSEASSGKTQSRGHITKTGNVHLRRVLVESAHSYRFRPSLQGAVKRRLAAVPTWEPALRQISWRAQIRLHDRLRRIGVKRGYNAAYTAVGRELCGYVWEVAVWVRATLAVDRRIADPAAQEVSIVAQ